jgi:hypothetical protein
MGDKMKNKKNELMDIDKQFCEESKIDKQNAWDKYLSKNSIMATSKHEPYIENKKKIVSLISMIYRLDSIDFTWEPQHVFISNDCTLGVTTGVYTRTYLIEEEVFEEIGKYVTTWQKEDDKWKIVFDMGN